MTPSTSRSSHPSVKNKPVSRSSGKARVQKSKPLAAKNETGERSGIQTFTAHDLSKMKFPSIRFAIPSYVPEGLTLLCGKPKIGKSWMSLDFAMAIATGGNALGSIPCEQGTVLYCALEDNRRRLQRRMRHRYGDESTWPKSFHFTTQMNRLDDGGLDDLRDWIVENDPSLIIIDTLVCVRAQKGRDSGTGYDADYAALAPLQELAGEFGVSIIVIHHLRKMAGDDPLDMVSGTTGLTGAVDTILILNRDGNGVTLYGRGREIEEVETSLKLEHGAWKVIGPASEARLSDERKAIIDIVAGADKPLSPSAIAEALNTDENNIKQLLRKMVNAGELEKRKRGQYELPKN
ncbi:AAA family ATPase [Agrobacterium rosae]|uniref:AAA family ATPase n=1 Tax=Agrobacterium rosae TaxID=1972867 RepID=UPI002A0BF4BA|nr:AAA family ATPase [Agrobacterium rosae]MDX8314426.1 AAA family ATPase [Agrobacterium rosae]